MPKPNPRSFRQLMGCFATGITVVTTRLGNGEAAGITINSLTSVSLDPPLVLFCLDKSAHIYPVFRNAKVFAINILSRDQEMLSRHFADFRRYPEPPKIWDRSRETCPILKDSLGWMVCRKTATYKGGDHDILLGEVISLQRRNGPIDPLLYFHGRYRRIKPQKV